MPRASYRTTSLAFMLAAILCLGAADLKVTTTHPGLEFARMVEGLITPDFSAFSRLVTALAQTVAFGLTGVVLGSVTGFGASLVYHWAPVRGLMAFLRSIHELFWALLFLQMFGLSPLTGLLAISVPYCGIFAKVYAEILDENEQPLLRSLMTEASSLSVLLFVRLPDALVHFRTYTLYRLECGLRSSAVLGFIGLPTLGFFLDSAFKDGHYSEVSALLLLFYALIAAIPLWVRPRLLPVYVLASVVLFVATSSPFSGGNVVRFLTHDIVPSPLRDGSLGEPATWGALADWAATILTSKALPGAVATFVLTQIALVATGITALATFPLVSRRFTGPLARHVGQLVLVVCRSTPEYILAYMALQLLGPSMLPAIIALALHNGAIIGHLMGRYSDALPQRPDAPRGLDLYAYEVLPQVYGQFLAFLLYRWEIIMRETAILGILGIYTLGFYIDSAMSLLRFDSALFLLVITGLLTILVDRISRMVRSALRLQAMAKAA